MAFFREYKVSTFSATFPLVEENTKSNADLVLYAIVNNKDIPDTLVNNTLHAFRPQIDNYYQYAQDEYTLGLPNGGSAHLNDVADSVLIPIIEEDLGYSIVLHSSFIAPMSGILAALPHLLDVRQIDLTTMIVGNPAEPLPEDAVSDLTLYVVAPSADGLTATIYYKYSYDTGLLITDGITEIRVRIVTEVINLPSELNIGNMYCIAELSNVATPDDHEWWYADLSGDVFPTLIESQETISNGDTFMPIIPIRYHNNSLITAATEDTDLYKTSKILAKKVGIDIDEIAAKLEENPDISEIDYAYITHGIDLNGASESQLYYVTEFFDFLKDKAYYTYLDHLQASKYDRHYMSNTYNFDAYAAHNVDLAVDQYKLNISIRYDYIRSETHVGRLGKVGYAESEIYSKQNDIEWDTFEEDLLHEIDWFIVFRAQISLNTYKEVTVCNLGHSNIIWHKKGVRTGIGDLVNSNGTPSDNHNFILLLHYGICDSLPKKISNTVFKESLCLIVNGYEKTAVPWYGTKFFMVIKLIVYMIVTYFTWVGGAAMAAAEGAAEVASQITLMMLLERLLIGIALQIALRAIGKILGPEYAAILGIVAAAIGAVVAINGGGFDAALTTTSLTGTITAQQLLAMATGLLNEAGRLTQNLITEVQDDIIDFQEAAATKQKALEAAIAELLPEHFSIDPMDLIVDESTFDEYKFFSPELYYHNRIHTGNPGVAVTSLPELYHKVMLQLPKIQYT